MADCVQTSEFVDCLPLCLDAGVLHFVGDKDIDKRCSIFDLGSISHGITFHLTPSETNSLYRHLLTSS